MGNDTPLSAPFAWSPRGWPSETAYASPEAAEVWCYTDRFSYLPGESIALHLSSSLPDFTVEITRDGAQPEVVWQRYGVTAARYTAPEDAHATGCGWPVGLRVEIPASWRSGFYIVTVRGNTSSGDVWEREHFFVVRAPVAQRTTVVLVVTTSTMLAYNDWGGANHYRGLGDDDPRCDVGSPLASTQRPIARGMVRKPVGAPREASNFDLPMGAQPRYPAYEWARLFGYSRHHADAFWATYERYFAVWAEANGYELDYLTQHDLHFDPHALDGYRCAVVVGHDEYWSWEMRDVVDAFVDGGGNVARFGGNFGWQVRLDDEGHTQYSYRSPARDPITATEPRRATTFWEVLSIDRPGASTMGLNALGGVYNRFGVACPRSSGGYTVYRPEHWAFDGTDLYYGDQLGGAPFYLAAFELDSVEYTFRRGLPYPTFEDGAPETLEILAMAPAMKGEQDRFEGRVPLGGPETEGDELDLASDMPAYLAESGSRGAGMIASFTRGDGEVFNGGTTEWPHVLALGDPYLEKVTHNVLERFGARGPASDM